MAEIKGVGANQPGSTSSQSVDVAALKLRLHQHKELVASQLGELQTTLNAFRSEMRAEFRALRESFSARSRQPPQPPPHTSTESSAAAVETTVSTPLKLRSTPPVGCSTAIVGFQDSSASTQARVSSSSSSQGGNSLLFSYSPTRPPDPNDLRGRPSIEREERLQISREEIAAGCSNLQQTTAAFKSETAEFNSEMPAAFRELRFECSTQSRQPPKPPPAMTDPHRCQQQQQLPFSPPTLSVPQQQHHYQGAWHWNPQGYCQPPPPQPNPHPPQQETPTTMIINGHSLPHQFPCVSRTHFSPSPADMRYTCHFLSTGGFTQNMEHDQKLFSLIYDCDGVGSKFGAELNGIDPNFIDRKEENFAERTGVNSAESRELRLLENISAEKDEHGLNLLIKRREYHAPHLFDKMLKTDELCKQEFGMVSQFCKLDDFVQARRALYSVIIPCFGSMITADGSLTGKIGVDDNLSTGDIHGQLQDDLLEELGDMCWTENAKRVAKFPLDIEQEGVVNVNDDLTRTVGQTLTLGPLIVFDKYGSSQGASGDHFMFTDKAKSVCLLAWWQQNWVKVTGGGIQFEIGALSYIGIIQKPLTDAVCCKRSLVIWDVAYCTLLLEFTWGLQHGGYFVRSATLVSQKFQGVVAMKVSYNEEVPNQPPPCDECSMLVWNPSDLTTVNVSQVTQLQLIPDLLELGKFLTVPCILRTTQIIGDIGKVEYAHTRIAIAKVSLFTTENLERIGLNMLLPKSAVVMFVSKNAKCVAQGSIKGETCVVEVQQMEHELVELRNHISLQGVMNLLQDISERAFAKFNPSVIWLVCLQGDGNSRIVSTLLMEFLLCPVTLKCLGQLQETRFFFSNGLNASLQVNSELSSLSYSSAPTVLIAGDIHSVVHLTSWAWLLVLQGHERGHAGNSAPPSSPSLLVVAKLLTWKFFLEKSLAMVFGAASFVSDSVIPTTQLVPWNPYVASVLLLPLHNAAKLLPFPTGHYMMREDMVAFWMWLPTILLHYQVWVSNLHDLIAITTPMLIGDECLIGELLFDYASAIMPTGSVVIILVCLLNGQLHLIISSIHICHYIMCWLHIDVILETTCSLANFKVAFGSGLTILLPNINEDASEIQQRFPEFNAET